MFSYKAHSKRNKFSLNYILLPVREIDRTLKRPHTTEPLVEHFRQTYQVNRQWATELHAERDRWIYSTNYANIFVRNNSSNNKNNVTAGAMRVDEIFLGHPCLLNKLLRRSIAIAYDLRHIFSRNMHDLDLAQLEWAKAKCKYSRLTEYVALPVPRRTIILYVSLWDILSSECARLWPLQSTKVKCKYANLKSILVFLFEGDSKVRSICHRLRDICENFYFLRANQSERRRKIRLTPFDWRYSNL